MVGGMEVETGVLVVQDVTVDAESGILLDMAVVSLDLTEVSVDSSGFALVL
jgi:hypothetical protein